MAENNENYPYTPSDKVDTKTTTDDDKIARGKIIEGTTVKDGLWLKADLFLNNWENDVNITLEGEPKGTLREILTNENPDFPLIRQIFSYYGLVINKLDLKDFLINLKELDNNGKKNVGVKINENSVRIFP